MKSQFEYYEEIKRTFPHTMSKDKFYQVAHISKATALYLLQSGLVPCKDSGKKTIALKINGCPTLGEGKLNITSKAFPVIDAGESQLLTYFAKISGDAPNADNVNAANVVITISIAD